LKFSYLGSSFTDVPACMARRSVTAASLPDILSRELIAGALPAGTTGGDFTNVLAGLVGAKFRLVRGYPGFQGEALALEKGELDVVCVSWAAMKARYPDILGDKSEFRVILRGDDGQDSELAQAGVPSVSSLPPNELDRNAFKWFMSQFAIASPFALPPNVPPAMAANLRRAFAETMGDEGFKSEARALKAEVNFTSGEVVDQTIDLINRAPPDVSERVRKALSAQP
jgi:hypothetical protein